MPKKWNIDQDCEMTLRDLKSCKIYSQLLLSVPISFCKKMVSFKVKPESVSSSDDWAVSGMGESESGNRFLYYLFGDRLIDPDNKGFLG